MASNERLPWGSLPLEHYVLSQWASLATDDHSERRRQLVRQYAAIGSSGRFVSVFTHARLWKLSPDVRKQLHVTHWAGQSGPKLPPQEEWESILAPIRTDFQRQLASPYSFQPDSFHCWGVIWLRTCYDEGTDEAHQRLLDELNLDLALEMEENILNNATLYDYGNDWQCIFEVIPERLFEEVLYDADMRDAPEERESRTREAQRNLDIDEMTDADTFKQATADFHSQAVCKYLFVSDKVALETGRVLIVFFDDCGRTVRQSRIKPEHCEEIAGAWSDNFFEEMGEFTEAEIGPHYLPGGLCGPSNAT
jgi:hypothetical protein